MTAAGTIERIRRYSALSLAAILVFGPWPGFTAMTWPRMRMPESIRSPMRSSALWRANSLVKRIGFLGHDLVAADDHGAFQRAALDQALFEQRLDVLVIDEGAGGADFLFVGLGRDLAGEILGEAAFRADVGDGDLEGLARDDGDDGAVAGFHDGSARGFPKPCAARSGRRCRLF